MMDWTDRHDRFFLRLISSRAVLYTEMVTTGAVLHGNREQLLGYDAAEHPLVLQLGGSDPVALAQSAKIAEDYGYGAVNLNVGCPSDRVQSGRFGACLMREPELVAECVAAMAAAVSIPVTVKCRIGVDEQDPAEALPAMARAVSAAGVRTLIVHARKAWLEGLSPKENREVPPLEYARVHALKQAMPQLEIIVNGGFANVAAALPHLDALDGVMFGRAAYQSPYMLAEVDPLLGHAGPVLSRHEVIESFIPYVERQMASGASFYSMARHILGLYQAMPGARAWRRLLSEKGPRIGHDVAAGRALLEEGLTLVPRYPEEAAAA